MYLYRECRMYVSSGYQLLFWFVQCRISDVYISSLVLWIIYETKIYAKNILTYEYRYIPLVIDYRIQELITFKNDITPC